MNATNKNTEVNTAQAVHTLFNSVWEYRPNGSDNGLDACFCIQGEPREYGQIDILGDPDIAAHVLRAVNSHAELVQAIKLAIDECQSVASSIAQTSANDSQMDALAFLIIALKKTLKKAGVQP